MLRSLLIFTCSLIFTQICEPPTPILASEAILAIESEPRLSEDQIRLILNQMAKANQQKNASEVTKFMAPFVTSNNRFITPKEILNTKVYGKLQHLYDLEGEYAGTESYKHHGYQAKVIVSPDRKFAIAQENYLLEVKLPANERVLFAIATRSKFRLIDNKPRIFAVDSIVEMENPSAFLLTTMQ
jgi:hypothetical protein